MYFLLHSSSLLVFLINQLLFFIVWHLVTVLPSSRPTSWHSHACSYPSSIVGFQYVLCNWIQVKYCGLGCSSAWISTIYNIVQVGNDSHSIPKSCLACELSQCDVEQYCSWISPTHCSQVSISINFF